jgi:cell division protease FtsH
VIVLDPDDREPLQSLARALRRYLEDPDPAKEPTVGDLLRAHLGTDELLPVISEELGEWDLPNVQLALDAALGRPGWSARMVGVGGQGRRYGMLALSDFLSGGSWPLGPVEYVNVPVGPDETLACLDFVVVLMSRPDGPLGLFIRRGGGPMESGLVVEAVAPDPAGARAFLADLRSEMDRLDVHRGQLITVGVTPQGGGRIEFMPRPDVGAEELVLPDGALERIERHLLGPTRHREALVRAGRHLGRGLLLWGPPGTGKTHTVRHLIGRATGATVIVLSGGSLGAVEAFGNLARRLAPSIVVLEDVDLVAEERSYGPYGAGGPVLFELMNQMSGVDDDADVAFVLTTNRPEVLEPALALRPGRVDLAVEIPIPDAAARGRLLDLYSRGLDARIEHPERIVERTEGMTASFFKELLRAATLAAVEAGSSQVTDREVGASLDELLAEHAAMTRVLLGAPRDEEGEPPPFSSDEF